MGTSSRSFRPSAAVRIVGRNKLAKFRHESPIRLSCTGGGSCATGCARAFWSLWWILGMATECNEAWRERLARSIDSACEDEGFVINAFVLMPEHVHLLDLPSSAESNVSPLLARIKQPFSKAIKQILVEHRSREMRPLQPSRRLEVVERSVLHQQRCRLGPAENEPSVCRTVCRRWRSDRPSILGALAKPSGTLLPPVPSSRCTRNNRLILHK